MAIHSLLGSGATFEDRYIPDYDQLKEVVDALKRIGSKIVLTMGVYDLLHVGHCRYLEEAKRRGDILIVGVDSDALTQQRKGPNRPVVPQDERLQMLYHLRCVDILTLRDAGRDTNEIIRVVRPDVLVTSESTKDFATAKSELAELCGEIVTLPPQATISTTARIRNLEMAGAYDAMTEVAAAIEGLEKIGETIRGVVARVAPNGHNGKGE